jgi:hypothetical protein
MEKNLDITDKEWEKLQRSPFDMEDFLKGLKMFDSVRHIAGGSDFSDNVYADMRKLEEFAGLVFTDRRRDSVGGMFLEASALRCLMTDLENYVSGVRGALESLERLRPESLNILDEPRI